MFDVRRYYGELGNATCVCGPAGASLRHDASVDGLRQGSCGDHQASLSFHAHNLVDGHRRYLRLSRDQPPDYIVAASRD